jgi:ribosome-associated toxin RatA of RatAB toxin-antitoxin module
MTAGHHAEHSVFTRAEPAIVFDLIADVTLWPALFSPTVHVDVLERDHEPGGATVERFRIHAVVGGAVRQWTSHRRVDPACLVIDFEQEHATPPFSRMSGRWEFRPEGGGTRVLLTHWFTPTDSTPESLQWIIDALDTNSGRELAAIRRATSARFSVNELIVACQDAVTTAQGAAAYDFINRADQWPDLLPHVEHVDLRHTADGLQDLTMTTRTPGGDPHVTRSIRLCSPPARIVYKQVQPPVGLIGHSGAWEFEPTGTINGATVTSRHTALVDPDTLTLNSDLGEIRNRIAGALSANSRATLSYAARQGLVEASVGE